MPFYLHFTWMDFCICSGIMLGINLIMSLQTKNFFTIHLVIKKFSILDLEFPASAQELASFIKDIFKLPGNLINKTLKALKGNLYLDFLYMPALYGSIFILSMKVSMKMTYFGHKLFAVLAWCQFIAWLGDVIENIYLLNKIRPDSVVSTPLVHKAYEILEIVKWVIPLITVVCSIAAMFYFWVVGRYSYESLNYIFIIVIEIILFFVVKKISTKSEEKLLEEFQQT
jgi:hypothetical protein